MHVTSWNLSLSSTMHPSSCNAVATERTENTAVMILMMILQSSVQNMIILHA